jgi:hypothetical protein
MQIYVYIHTQTDTDREFYPKFEYGAPPVPSNKHFANYSDMMSIFIYLQNRAKFSISLQKNACPLLQGLSFDEITEKTVRERITVNIAYLLGIKISAVVKG